MKLPKTVRLILIKETIILLFGFVWLWFSIGLYVDSNYSIANLKPHHGLIEGIDSSVVKVKSKPLFKEITQELQINLSTDNSIYTLQTTGNFSNIVSKIDVGDSVTIFTKPKLWGVFGLKKASVINHLTKGKEVVLDYRTYKSSISALFYLTLIFSIIFFIVYIVKLRNRIWWDFGGYESKQSIT